MAVKPDGGAMRCENCGLVPTSGQVVPRSWMTGRRMAGGGGAADWTLSFAKLATCDDCWALHEKVRALAPREAPAIRWAAWVAQRIAGLVHLQRP